MRMCAQLTTNRKRLPLDLLVNTEHSVHKENNDKDSFLERVNVL